MRSGKSSATRSSLSTAVPFAHPWHRRHGRRLQHPLRCCAPPWPYAGIERICDVSITDTAGHDGPSGLTGRKFANCARPTLPRMWLSQTTTNQTVTGGDIPDDVVVDDDVRIAFRSSSGCDPSLAGTLYAGRCPRWPWDPQPVAVLSYKFWQRHYRGDPAIVGKSIQLNHKTLHHPRRDAGALHVEGWRCLRSL